MRIADGWRVCLRESSISSCGFSISLVFSAPTAHHVSSCYANIRVCSQLYCTCLFLIQSLSMFQLQHILVCAYKTAKLAATNERVVTQNGQTFCCSAWRACASHSWKQYGRSARALNRNQQRRHIFYDNWLLPFLFLFLVTRLALLI